MINNIGEELIKNDLEILNNGIWNLLDKYKNKLIDKYFYNSENSNQ